MGIPGLYKFLSKCYGDEIFTSESFQYSNILIDGNVLLYEFLGISGGLDPSGFCKYVSNYVNRYGSNLNVIIAFDGLPPHAKIREQIKRRKYRELTNGVSITLQNESCINIIEFNLVQLGWVVLSHKDVGEGEQKLANYIANNNLDKVLVVSRDWDLILILMPLSLNKTICLDMMFLTKLIDVSKFVDLVGVNNLLHFISCIIIFGTDFFPGIANIPLEYDYINELLSSNPWVFVINSNVVIIKEQFLKALTILTKAYFNQMNDSCKKNCSICSPQESSDENIISFMCSYSWTIGYFYLRNHRHVITQNSFQQSNIDLGINLISLTQFVNNKIKIRFTIDIVVDIVEQEHYNYIIQNMNNIKMNILPSCGFHIKSYTPFITLDI